MLVWANYYRGGTYPLFWNENLAKAARYHSDDTASQIETCAGHNSCDGTLWSVRIQKFYPSLGGYYHIGENYMGVEYSGARELQAGFFSAPMHRANILDIGYNETGAAIVQADYYGKPLYVTTQDFGYRTNLPSTQTIIGATISKANLETLIMVSYSDRLKGKSPQYVRARVNSNSIPLDLMSGQPQNAVYGNRT